GERGNVLGTEVEFVAEVLEVLLREPYVLEEPETRLEPCRHQKAAPRREPAHEQAERSGVGHPAAQVARRHVQLVEVGRQGARHDRSPTGWSLEPPRIPHASVDRAAGLRFTPVADNEREPMRVGRLAAPTVAVTEQGAAGGNIVHVEPPRQNVVLILTDDQRWDA